MRAKHSFSHSLFLVLGEGGKYRLRSEFSEVDPICMVSLARRICEQLARRSFRCFTTTSCAQLSRQGINNAGIYGMGKRQVTADGLELTMATNHFGHFLLTNLLLGRLKESGRSRIINVSSLGHAFAPKFDLNDLAISKNYNPTNAYSTSKLCNLLFTRELADKLAGTDVTVNSLHPGLVQTEIFDSMNFSFGTLITNIMLAVASKDAVSGAQTNIHLAVSEEVEGVTGKYFVDCKETPTRGGKVRKDLATGLWEASVKAVELKKDEIHY
ncbi:Retinol dehydrogenase 14 [Portunus trituberculatus]|uniref:Retinol dehydrogenase 14 n=1 Tax=Portunus trituberculatus TaxID=210409 RepID=A0A5B7EBR3_PORTR|nr:Retinol dehydrogenase 14 [Portunus trituberculatus]